MADTFESVRNKYQNSPTVIVLFVASFVMFVIGLNNFAEDTYSSYLGLKSIETTLGMNVQIFNWTYWAMSLAPQIASIVFFYLFLSTGDKKYALISFGSQAMDFIADTWYRGNGALLTDPRVAIASGLLTFFYFSIGSEFFLTISAGLLIKLYAPAIREYKKALGEIQGAYASKGGGGGGKQHQSSQQSYKTNGGGDYPHGGGKDRRAQLEAQFRQSQGGGGGDLGDTGEYRSVRR